MCKKIQASLAIRGAIVSMEDKVPTGHYKRHNYVVVSDITPDTTSVICFGITTCRNGTWEGVIPITSTNGVDCYINTNRIFEFGYSEFSNAHHHGYITDDEIIENLIAAVKLRVGLLNRAEIENIKESLSKITVKLRDANIIEEPENGFDDEEPEVEVVEEDVNEDSDTTSSPSDDEPIPTTRESPAPSTSPSTRIIYPYHTSRWSNDQIIEYIVKYEKGDYDTCRSHMMTRKGGKEMITEKVLLKKYNQAVEQQKKRKVVITTPETSVKSLFSDKAKKYSCAYWSNEDLQTFSRLYGTGPGRSILKSEFKLTDAGIISKFSEVSRHLKARK